jgi:outer membrane protein OmpA-like peptidoglycan-associated protein
MNVQREARTKESSISHVPSSLSRLHNAVSHTHAYEGTLQHTSVNTASAEAFSTVHNVINSSGQPLDTGTRVFMEPRFGHDFSNVRVHTDTQAAESARSVNALAYTVGRDVVFDQGKYQPETMTGKGLLAHELTHVVQQEAIATPGSASGTLSIGAVSDPMEQSANQAARGIMSPHVLNSGTITQLTTPTIQRQPAPDVSAPQLAQPALTKEQGVQSFTIAEFPLGGTKLTGQQQKNLSEAAEQIRAILAAHPDAYISIVGHTDTTGTDERNEVVGQGRSEEVMKFLVAKKLPQNIMYASNKGPNEPAIKTGKNVQEPRNRRVEISVKQQEKSVPPQKGTLPEQKSVPPLPSDAPTQHPSIVKPKPPDLTYHPQYHEETPGERYKRIDAEIKKAEKMPRKQGESALDVLNHAVDNLINPLMESLHVPEKFRGMIRDAAHAGVEKGIESLVDTAMDQAGLDSNQKDAIRNTVKGILQYKSQEQKQEGQKQ